MNWISRIISAFVVASFAVMLVEAKPFINHFWLPPMPRSLRPISVALNKNVWNSNSLNGRLGLRTSGAPQQQQQEGDRQPYEGDRYYNFRNPKQVNKRDWRYWMALGPYQYGENLEQMQDNMVYGVEDNYLESSALENQQDNSIQGFGGQEGYMLPPTPIQQRRRW